MPPVVLRKSSVTQPADPAAPRAAGSVTRPNRLGAGVPVVVLASVLVPGGVLVPTDVLVGVLVWVAVPVAVAAAAVTLTGMVTPKSTPLWARRKVRLVVPEAGADP